MSTARAAVCKRAQNVLVAVMPQGRASNATQHVPPAQGTLTEIVSRAHQFTPHYQTQEYDCAMKTEAMMRIHSASALMDFMRIALDV